MIYRKPSWTGVRPDRDEVVALLVSLPDSVGIRPEIAEVAVARLEKAADKPSAAACSRSSRLLDNRRLAPESGPLVRRAGGRPGCPCIHRRRPVPPDRARAQVLPRGPRRALPGRTPSRRGRSRLADVLQAAVACRHPELGGAVLVTLIPHCREGSSTGGPPTAWPGQGPGRAVGNRR